jgi:GT2 family glycosyltransferase
MNLTPFFSVIIPTYHRNDLLAKCLDCLAPGIQTLPAEQYEVIVTDDGSETTAQEMIQNCYPWARWMAGPRKGPAANRNHAAKYAQGKWLAFLDDDCLPDPQWLKAYANASAAEPSCLVFAGRVYADRPRRSLAEYSPIFESGGRLPSGNFTIQKQLFESMGGFDERFYTAMEDLDMMVRLKKMGYQFPFVKSAAVCHPWRTSYAGKDGWKLNKGYCDSMLTYLSIHPEEAANFNSLLYIRRSLSRFLKETLPGLMTYKGAGLGVAWAQHIFELKMAIYLLLKN